MQKKRLYPLDAIRGFAALTIAFLWHYQHFNPQHGSPFESIFYIGYHYGFMAVELFFMLSGFVMMYLYTDRIAEHAITLKEYMKKRILRFYPLMIITLLVMAGFQLYNEKTIGSWVVYGQNDLIHFVQNLLLLHGGVFDGKASFNGPSWCVTVELICYLLFFVVIHRAAKDEDKRLLYLGLVWITSFVIYKVSPEYPVINGLVARGVVSFFTGCFVYYLYEKIRKYKKEKLVGILCLVALILIAVLNEFVTDNMFISADGSQMCTLFLFAPCMILIGLFVPGINTLLSLRPFVYLGNISFSIYMWHVPVQFAIMCGLRMLKKEWDFSQPKYFFVYIILTMIVAIVSYEIYEKKMKRLLLGEKNKRNKGGNKKHER